MKDKTTPVFIKALRHPNGVRGRQFLATLLGGLSALSLLSGQPGYGNQKVAALAEQFTVRIEGATQGSGVLVENSDDLYTVLTSWHVLKAHTPSDELDIFTSDGMRHKAIIESIQQVGAVDLAVVSFQSQNRYALPTISNKPSNASGATSYVAGFPLPSTAVPARILRFTSGNIIAEAKVEIPNGYQLLYSNSTFPGMSGGSVLDSAGHLIGIHGQGEVDSMATKAEGLAVKTGTNQAVPIGYYVRFKNGTAINSPKTGQSGFSSFEDLLAESKYILAKYKTDLTELEEAGQSGQLSFYKLNQDNLDRAILKAEEASRRKDSPEAFLMAGTGYLYKEWAYFKLNWNSDDLINNKPRYEAVEKERKRLKTKVLINLDAAIYLDPDNIDALKYRGSVKEDDEVGTGIGDFNKILELDRTNVEALDKRASAYFSKGLGLGFEDVSRAQKKSYLRLAIEDQTLLLRLDDNDHNARWGRALAGHALYKLVKYDNGFDDTILSTVCDDAYKSNKATNGAVNTFPNLPSIKEMFDDCISFASSKTEKKYSRNDPSSVPAGFALNPRYEFEIPDNVCEPGWSNKACAFRRQFLHGVLLLRFGKCLVESGESSAEAFDDFFAYKLGPETYFSPEVVNLLISMGGVEGKSVTNVYKRLGCNFAN